MNDYKKYLPSKKFIATCIIILILIVSFFLLKGVIYLFKKIHIGGLNKGEVNQVTVKEIAQTDSNNNGIPDWEEYLWGLDPNGNGVKNKEIILEKKGALSQNNGVSPADDSKPITNNEALSREFFAAIISLQQTGSLDEQSMKSISDAIGENIKTEEIKDVYTIDQLTTENDSLEAKNTYHEELVSLVKKYSNSDIGNELTFIVQGLNNKDTQALYAAKTVADAYQSFSKDLIKIKVPKSLAYAQLNAANDYFKTGQTIISLTTMLNDPIIGMKGILSYKKYSDALATDLDKVSELLQ